MACLWQFIPSDFKISWESGFCCKRTTKMQINLWIIAVKSLFCFILILYVPVNIFSARSGRDFLGKTSTKQGLMCRAREHNAVTPRWGSNLHPLDLESAAVLNSFGSSMAQKEFSAVAQPGRGVVLWYFPTYVGSGHFFGSKFWISLFIYFFFWGGGVQKNEYFFGYEDFVDIFWGSSQNWTIFRGYFYAF